MHRWRAARATGVRDRRHPAGSSAYREPSRETWSGSAGGDADRGAASVSVATGKYVDVLLGHVGTGSCSTNELVGRGDRAGVRCCSERCARGRSLSTEGGGCNPAWPRAAKVARSAERKLMPKKANPCASRSRSSRGDEASSWQQSAGS